MEVNYVVDVPTDTFTVTLMFGDGQQETFTTITGGTSHTFSCSQAQCTYEVSIHVTTPNGLESALNTASSVKVVVQ
jgi:hypothetical protein